MYGMVNRALRAMVLDQGGTARWQQVCRLAGLDADDFDPMRQYPDTLTTALVAAVAASLERTVPDTLEAFGVHWIGFARSHGYESLLLGTASNLFDFLESLDDMHTRLALSFSDYRPPSFYCTDRTATEVRLHYVSEREGLAPFVRGLLHGLGALFATPLHVDHEQDRAAGADHDVFLLRLLRIDR